MRMKGLSDKGVEIEETEGAPKSPVGGATDPSSPRRGLSMKGMPGGFEPPSGAPSVPEGGSPPSPPSVSLFPAPAARMRELAEMIRGDLRDGLVPRLRQRHDAAVAAEQAAEHGASRRERFAGWLLRSSRYAKEAASSPLDRTVNIAPLIEETERVLAGTTGADADVFARPISMLERILTKISDLGSQRSHLSEPEFRQEFAIAAALALVGAGGVVIHAGAVSGVVALGILSSIIGALFVRSEVRRRLAIRAVNAERQRIDGEIEYLRGDLRCCLDAYVAESQKRGRTQRAAARAERERIASETAALLAEEISHLQQKVSELHSALGYLTADWDHPGWARWKPANTVAPALRFGSLRFPVPEAGRLPAAKDLRMDFRLTALVSLRNGQGVLFSAHAAHMEPVIAAVQAMITRLLATIPPGRLYLTFVDPVGLGKNVGAFMGLRDHLDRLVNIRAWTEPSDIENRLGELVEQIEDIIQRRIPDPKETIEDYNARAGALAEPYRVVVILDFPRNFTDTALRRLVSLAQSGPRCGLYLIVLRDLGQELPYRFDIADIELAMVRIEEKSGHFVWRDGVIESAELTLDASAPNALTKTIVEAFGAAAKDAEKVEIKYAALLDRIALAPATWGTRSTLHYLEIPLGITGRGDIVHLRLGEAGTTLHHGLMAGRPGSGKSNLMHIIVSTGALAYPPEELELYLVDLKAGVEFNFYANNNLAHARVIAIDNDPDYGLSVLEGLRDELNRRGKLCQEAGVREITAYRTQTGRPMSRILLLVDEFQVLFPGDNAALASRAATVIDEIVRLGRFVGIHVLLSSQNIGRGDTLPSKTADLMPIRIGMQCSLQDSRQLLNDDNLAAAHLTRAGQAIYNQGGGIKESNVEFQVALMTDSDLSAQFDAIEGYLAKRGLTEETRRRPRFFLGHERARMEQCEPLALALQRYPSGATRSSTLTWLGEPIAMEPPVAAELMAQSGRNLVVVTRDEAEGMGILLAVVLSIAAQDPATDAELHILDLSSRDAASAGLARQLAEGLPHSVDVAEPRQIADQLKMLHALLQERLAAGGASSPTVYLVVLGLHRARVLHEGDDFYSRDDEADPRNQLLKILRDGPELGIHVLAWCDSVPSLQRMGRAPMGEFLMRVAGAMGESDSSQLIDTTAAAKLKPNRAIYVNLDQPGSLTQFRPYALPDPHWLTSTLARLKGRAVV